MKNQEELIELGLRGPGAPDPSLPTILTLLDQSLALLRDFLASGEGADRRVVCDHIEECRAAIAAEADAEMIGTLGTQCLNACRGIIAQVEALQVERRREVSSLIELVREALASVAGDNNSFHSNLTHSTERFEALARLDDLRQIKVQLAREISELKKITLERQAQWESTHAKLAKRVEALEHQLAVSRREAAMDPLTKIANRHAFDKTLAEWLQSDRMNFVLAFLDIDHFKTINDSHGHRSGDQVLVSVAQALKGSIRSTDLVARFGGDEFAVLVVDLTLRQAESRFGAVVSGLAGSKFQANEAQPFSLTVSCGLAEYSAGDTMESLVQRADEALYDAKRRGRNRVAAKERPFLRDLLRRP